MSNSWFQFKEFRVEQDRCAMKVSTDACIQGAWTPVSSSVNNVLDIGCGTGLLSLMLAQRNPGIRIDAIELDEAAAQQATENVMASPWADRIQVIQADARTFAGNKKYDLIICNPPFFNNSLLGPEQQRNHARHTLSLSYSELFDCIAANLQPSGKAVVLLPSAEHLTWEKLLVAKGWFVTQQLLISPRTGSTHNRVVSVYTPVAAQQFQTEKLAIRQETGNDYTPEFMQLLRPFYLHI